MKSDKKKETKKREDKLAVQNITNALLSASEDTENETDNDTVKTIRQLPKPKFRKHPILSPMNSCDSSTRDYDSDSDMPGLQEGAREDESNDDAQRQEQK